MRIPINRYTKVCILNSVQCWTYIELMTINKAQIGQNGRRYALLFILNYNQIIIDKDCNPYYWFFWLRVTFKYVYRATGPLISHVFLSNRYILQKFKTTTNTRILLFVQIMPLTNALYSFINVQMCIVYVLCVFILKIILFQEDTELYLEKGWTRFVIQALFSYRNEIFWIK